MIRSNFLFLGDLQLEVMKILWQKRQVTVHEAHELLGNRRVHRAYTTVLTVLRNLHKIGFVERSKASRRHVYSVIIERDEYKRDVLERIVQDYYGGSRKRLLTSLQQKGKR